MKYTKVIAAVLAILLSAGATVAYAKNQDSDEDNVKTASAPKAEETVQLKRSGDGQPEKDETVYVLYSSGNDVKEVIVSDWLQNAKGLDSLSDISDLK